MKVNISVEATAQEMRELMGLPDVQPLHDEIMQNVRESMQRGVVNFDALGVLTPLFPAQMNSLGMMQKFWETVAKTSTGKSTKKDGDTSLSPESSEPAVTESNPKK